MSTKDEIKLHYYKNAFRNAIKKGAFQDIWDDYYDEFITKEQYFEYVKTLAIKLEKLPNDEKEREKHLEVLEEIILENKDLCSNGLGRYYVHVDDVSDLLGIEEKELIELMDNEQ